MGQDTYLSSRDYTPVVIALVRLKQEGCECEANLSLHSECKARLGRLLRY